MRGTQKEPMMKRIPPDGDDAVTLKPDASSFSRGFRGKTSLT